MGDVPGASCVLTQELIYSFPIPRGVILPLLHKAVAQAAQRGQATAHSHTESGRTGIQSLFPPSQAASQENQK